jgi:hypothetical protein
VIARPLLIFALAVAALIAPGAGGDAWARPPAPIGLEVRDGEESWHDSNRFYLDWQLPDTGYVLPVVATNYLIRGPSGIVVAERRWDGPVERTDFFLHSGPGQYTVAVWLEDMVGAGPPAEALLRFDDSRPGFARAEPVDGWIGRTDFPHTIRIEHPQGAPPPSGIRGYAISIDGSRDGRPCEDPSRCTETETDLRGGIGDDSLPIPELPEGASHVHVVAVSGSGMSSAEVGETVLRVDRTDPVTQLGGGPGGWANRAVAVTITATDSGSGMAGGGAFTAVQIDSARPTVAAGDSVTTTVIGDGIHRLVHYARDAAGNVNDGAARNGVRDRSPALATIGIDRDPPEVAFIDSQDPADPELIRALVADPLAGPSAVRGSIGVRAAGSGDRFQPLATAILAGELRARWDSEGYPPGRYEFRATGYDAAGNATIAERRLDGAPMLLANPLKAPTALSLGFGGETLVWQHCTRERGGRRCRREEVSGFASRPRVRLVPYGRGTLVSGRLTTAPGAPLAAAPIRILEHLGRGSGSTSRIATVTTDPDGDFSLRLPDGPSREISASFDGTRTLTRSAATSLRLGVRTRVRLRVSSDTAEVGGAPILFSGRVIAGEGEIPAQGKALALQFRVPGVPWTEFRTVRTDRNGRFRYPYAFSDDDSRGARFQFRAYAPAQSDWPYEPGSSGPVAVLGI